MIISSVTIRNIYNKKPPKFLEQNFDGTKQLKYRHDEFNELTDYVKGRVSQDPYL